MINQGAIKAKWFRVAALKIKMRALYQRIQARSAELDCGAALAEQIRPDIARDRAEFNRLLEECKSLDPAATNLEPL